MAACILQKCRGLSVAFTTVACLGIASSAHANLIVNGSFESPIVPASSLSCGVVFNTECQGYYSPDQPGYPGGPSDIGGWSVIGLGSGFGTAVVMQLGNGYTEPDFGSGATLHFYAQHGNQSLDLTGEGNEGYNGVKQSISSVPGDLYTIAFRIGHQYDQAPGYAGPSFVDFYIDGLFVDTYSNAQNTLENVNWERFTYSFTADDILTTFAFISSTPLGNNYAGLDNVVLRDLTVVPEPGSLPLLALGVAILAIIPRPKLAKITRRQ